MQGAIPSELGALTRISYALFLESNKLSGTIPTELGALTRTTILYVSRLRVALVSASTRPSPSPHCARV